RPPCVPILDLRQPPVGRYDLPQRKLLVTRPQYVGRVAKSAHHQNTGAFFRINQLACKDWDRNPKQRSDGMFPDQPPIPLVIRMRGYSNASRQQLRPSRRNNKGTLIILNAEAYTV